MSGRVWFVGAGPGAADLLTLRAVRVLGEADVVVWARSLVDPRCSSTRGRTPSWSRPTTRRSTTCSRSTAAPPARACGVARVHSGDPTLYGTLHEQLRACRELGLECEIVPGVSSLAAAAAALGQELTVPDVSPVADPHPPRAAHVDAAQRGAGRVRRPRDDDGAVPLGPPPARAAGRPDRGRLRAGHAVRGRLQGELAGRDRDPLPAVRARRADPRGEDHDPGARARRPGAGRGRAAARTSTTPATATATARSAARTATASGSRARERADRRARRVGGRRPAGHRAAARRRRVVAGGRAVLGRSRRRGAPGRARRGPRGDARGARSRAGPRRACSRRATPASSASSARSARSSAASGSRCTPRRPRSRSRSPGSASRGTTRWSSPPTGATRGPRSTPRSPPEGRDPHRARQRRRDRRGAARPSSDRRRGARHAGRAPAPMNRPSREPNVVMVEGRRARASAPDRAGRCPRTRSSTAPA